MQLAARLAHKASPVLSASLAPCRKALLISPASLSWLHSSSSVSHPVPKRPTEPLLSSPSSISSSNSSSTTVATSKHAGKPGSNAALLQHVDPENRKDLLRVLELADRAADHWDVTYTNFLSPALVGDAMAALASRADVTVIPWGGYAQAERCRLAIARPDLLEGAASDPGQALTGVAAVEVTGNFLFDPAKHSDFLGAVLGTGVVRERVGDILVQGETGAQILVDPELVEHFEASLVQVRSVPVRAQRLALSSLKVRPAKVEEVSSVEASLRLDALASAGFRMSRSKMMDLIKAGGVRVNWKVAAKPSVELKAGDVVSCAGKGRLELRSIELTKKERYHVTMVRFV